MRELNRLEKLICLTALGFMFLAGALEVLSRNIIGYSFFWVQEFIVILLVWEVFMGAAYIFSTSSLICVSILYDKLSYFGKKVLDIINDIIVFIILAALLRFGWNYMMMQTAFTTTALHVNQCIYSIPMLISAASMALEIVRRFIIRLRRAGSEGG